MAAWQREEVETNGIKLSYVRTHSGRSPLLLAHGLTDNGLCYRRVAEEMQRYFDVIMLDARGHGESDKPETGYSFETHADDIVGVIEALELEQPTVMGHAMGATSLGIVTARHPELVSCAILEDPVWRVPPGTTGDQEDFAQRVASVAAKQELSPYEILMQGRMDNPTWDADEFPDWVEAKQQVVPEAMELVIEPNPDWTELVKQIEKPVLLIYGDPTLGSIVTPSVAAEAHRLNSLIVPHQMSGAGHNIRRMQYEPFMSAVQEFVAAVRQDRIPA